MSSRLIVEELIATRGDRLALVRMRGVGEDASVGPSEIEELAIGEVDALGKLVALVVFDLEDVDVAYAELDDRYDDHERAARGRPLAVSRFSALFAARQWDRIGALLSPALIVQDHRALGWGTICGPADYLALLKSLAELSPDAVIRADHMRGHDRGALIVTMLRGTRDGGIFEDPRVLVAEFDVQKRICRFDFYSPEQLDEAIARFDALRSNAPEIPPNAATRTSDRWQEAFARRDYDEIAALYAPTAVWEDRRRMIRLTGGRDALLASARLVGSLPSMRLERSVLATSGDRLALLRLRWAGGEHSGAFEVEHLHVIEVDDDGRITAIIELDRDDRRSAIREMCDRQARSLAARGMPVAGVALLRALIDRDLDALHAMLSDGFVFHDHRRAGAGRIEGADGYVRWVRTLFEQSPDGLIETRYRVAESKRGFLSVAQTFGTLAEGGEFESIYVVLAILDADRVVGVELFELDDLDLARARFEALRTDPLRIPPNAAQRAADRWQEAYDRRDWAGVEAQFALSLDYDDRRRVTRLTGDRETLLASVRYVGSRSGTRVSRSTLATAGDRLVLERYRWAGGGMEVGFEVEGLCLTEVDDQERVVAHVIFDVDDRRAASREMLERFLRSDATRPLPPGSVEFLRALFDHDLERCRAALPDGFVLDDHRRAGMGRVEGADAYVESLAALFAQAPNAVIEPLYDVAVEAHGFLTVAHTFGTLVDGGEFESVYVQLGHHSANGIIDAELYELDDLNVARVRFEELRPKATLIPPNAASRVHDLMHRTISAGSEEGFRALLSADFVYDDRTRQSLVTGGVDEALRSAAHYRALQDVRFEGKRIAALGDRLLVEHLSVRGGPPGGEAEVEGLLVIEIDAEGHVVALVNFDVDDRRAALAEAHARFAAGEAAGLAGQVPVLAIAEALQAHDYRQARRWLAEDFVIRDHRSFGLFEGMSGEGWLDSLRVHAEMAPDLYGEILAVLAVNDCGRVELNRVMGTAADGVAFENVFLRVTVSDGTVVRHLELFEPEDRVRALARFEELSAASSAARAAGSAPPARPRRRACRRA